MVKEYIGKRILQLMPDNTGAVAVYADGDQGEYHEVKVAAWALLEGQLDNGKFITSVEAMTASQDGALDLCWEFKNFMHLEFPE